MSVVSVCDIPLEKYKEVVGEKKVIEIESIAEKISSQTVCHINSTSHGGGVSEILHRLVPLMRSVGIKAEWKVIKGSDKFFRITKTLHNGLQGMEISLTDEMKRTYLYTNEENAKELNLKDYSFVIIHDPQPAAIISNYPCRHGKWIWRCHIDLSTPNQTAINFISPFLLQYDVLIFSMAQYVPDFLKSKHVSIIPPSIDPLSDKNKPLKEAEIFSILDKYDVNPENPIITQVARFDPWKDPLGAIDVYRIVKKKMPRTHLSLIASMALDDPEGWIYYEKTARYAGGDYEIHLLTDLIGVRDKEVNAFQRASDVALQMSIREGFGLSITEALWKETPVVARAVGGIPLQVKDGKTGFLINNPQEAAEKIV
ncbi:glycosyl transferase family 1, partial [Candidatus Bathyarchaeota archaeon]